MRLIALNPRSKKTRFWGLETHQLLGPVRPVMERIDPQLAIQSNPKITVMQQHVTSFSTEKLLWGSDNTTYQRLRFSSYQQNFLGQAENLFCCQSVLLIQQPLSFPILGVSGVSIFVDEKLQEAARFR